MVGLFLQAKDPNVFPELKRLKVRSPSLMKPLLCPTPEMDPFLFLVFSPRTVFTRPGLVGWLVSWWVGWLFGWLVGWLVSWLAASPASPASLGLPIVSDWEGVAGGWFMLRVV